MNIKALSTFLLFTAACICHAQTSTISRSVNIFGDTVVSNRNSHGQIISEATFSKDIFGNRIYTLKDGRGRTIKSAKEERDIFGDTKVLITEGTGRPAITIKSHKDIFGNVTKKVYDANSRILRSIEHSTDIFGNKVITVKDESGRQLERIELRKEDSDKYSVHGAGNRRDKTDIVDYWLCFDDKLSDKGSSSDRATRLEDTGLTGIISSDGERMLTRINDIFSIESPVKVRSSRPKVLTGAQEFIISDQNDRVICSLNISLSPFRGGLVRTLSGEDGKVLFTLKPSLSISGKESVKLRDRHNKVLLSIGTTLDPWNNHTAILTDVGGTILTADAARQVLTENLRGVQQSRTAELVNFMVSVIHEALY